MSSFLKRYFLLLCALSLFMIHLNLKAQDTTQPDSLWSFGSVRADLDNDGLPDFIDQNVVITGIVNVSSGILHEKYLQIYIQDDSTGMSVFARQIDKPVEIGDSLVVYGKVDFFSGFAEVKADSYKVYQNNSDPNLYPITTVIENPELFLGALAGGEVEIIEKGDTFNGKFLRVTAGNTDQTIMVYVSNFHSMFSGFNFGVLQPGDRIYVKGIITDYNNEGLEEPDYKLFLRTPDDLSISGIPKLYMNSVVLGLLVLIVIAVAWVIILKRQVAAKTSQIQQSLEQKEMLLKEIHHRVKNSLSIVSGLLQLQIMSADNEEVGNILKDSQTRIQSVGLIHEKLYKTDSLSAVELGAYIEELVRSIHETFSELKDSVELQFDLDEVFLKTDRIIHCGLLVNELVVNAFKHAFSKQSSGLLRISLKKKNGEVVLTVCDNGPGLSDDFKLEGDDNLGTMLITSFAENLDAAIEISELDEGGTCFSFRIPL
jgi:two-component sensor histidine kinase